MTTALTDAVTDEASSARAARQRVAPSVERLRDWIGALALCAIAFGQDSGRVVADTKLDLVIDPVGFLARSLHVWDAQSAFGQVQNQAYGYLWPMGPFFALGHALDLPGWVVQRLWWCLLLVLAYAGLLSLLRLWGIGSPWSQRVAALAFALGPRILASLGTISVEAWPTALLPWVMLPLVRGARAGSPRRAAALSALIVACMGGVNATATAAVLIVPLIYLVTREAGPRRRRLVGWWLVGTALATAWWVVPLVVLSRFSYPFLGYIESAATTTSPTSLLDVLRGTDHWLGFLVVDGQPTWSAGWWLSTSTIGVLATTTVAAIGVSGLVAARCAERRFLRLSLLTGVVLITAGYGGALGSPWAGHVQRLLDGPLSPLRNVHKLDVLVLLPVCVGLAAAIPALPRVARRVMQPGFVDDESLRRGAAAATVGAVAMVVLAAWSPAWRGDIAPRGSFVAVPEAWTQAADWLTAHSDGDRALVLPASNFGEYTWGRPLDEPLQSLAGAPWAVRNAVPLGAPGVTRWMDGVQAVVSTGSPSPDLAAALAAAGVRYLVVRHDLDPSTGVEPGSVIHAAVASSPGIALVATFGQTATDPVVPGGPSFGSPQLPELEIFATTPSSPGSVSAVPLADVSSAVAGPEMTFPTGDPSGSWVAAADAGDLPLRAGVVTDTPRRRALDVGAQRGRDYSPTLPASEPIARGRSVGDVSPWPPGTMETSLEYVGVSDVRASSSAADPYAQGYRGPDRRPFSAIDGRRTTEWLSALGDPAPWLQISLSARTVREISLSVAGASQVTDVSVRTEAGSATSNVGPDGDVRVALPDGETTWIRVTLARRYGSQSSIGIRELSAPGLSASETLRVGGTVGAAGATFARAPGARRSCLDVGGSWACSPLLQRAGEEVVALDRSFATEGARGYGLSATVAMLDGTALDASLDAARGLQVEGSSAYVADAAARPGAAVDADPSTAWLPSPRDVAPRLKVAFGRPVTLSSFDLGPQARGISGVVVRSGSTTQEATVEGSRVTFAPRTADAWTLTFRTSSGQSTFPTPARIDLAFPTDVVPAEATVDVPCGRGPALRLDAGVVPLSISADARAIVHRGTAEATSCEASVHLASGEHRLRSQDSTAWAVTGVTMTGTASAVSPALASSLISSTAESRTVAVGAGPAALLVLDEGFNPGWVATQAGLDLHAVRAEGWKQAFVVPASLSPRQVVVTFGPGEGHRAALATGFLLLLVLVALAVVPGRGSHPSLRAAPSRRPLSTMVAVVVPGLVGGLVGLIVGLGVVVLTRRHSRVLRAATATGCLIGAALLAVVAGRSWGEGALPALQQALCLGALAVVSLDDDSAADGDRATFAP